MELTRRILWRKFRMATDKYDFLNYVQTVSEELYTEMVVYLHDNYTDSLKQFEEEFRTLFINKN